MVVPSGPVRGETGAPGTIGLDDMVGGLHRGGHIHHHAVFQLAVHIAVAGGDSLLAFRTMAHCGGAAGVAEIQAGVDVLGIVGDGLRLHTVGVVHAVHRDGGTCAHQLVQSRLGVVVTLQGDTGTLQGIRTVPNTILTGYS